MSAVATTELTEQFRQFLATHYADAIAELAQHYPTEQRSLEIAYDDLARYDQNLADDWLATPEQIHPHAEDALQQVDLPVDVDDDFADAHVRLTGLDAADRYYPGAFSPRDCAGEYLTVEGQVARATEVYATMVEAAFECERCGTPTYIPQTDSGFQEPHECHGCERQGPFSVNFDHSAFIDGQKLRIEEPPERTATGDTSHIDVFLEDDLVDRVQPGDKVAVTGIVHLEQQSSGNRKQNKFEPYMEAHAIARRDTTFEDIAIEDADEERIHELATSEDPDIYDLAVDSIAPGIHGAAYEPIKLAIFLQLVAGTRAVQNGTGDRGDFHQLLVGDPSTGKSDLQEGAREIAPRAVSVSGKGASKAGITASAVRDDFSAGDEWTLEAGALVQANDGLAAIDELDKMPTEVVESMHRAMEQQQIPISKAGINTELPARTAVLAAANPAHSRWDPYEPAHEQLDLASTLLSRFALVWKLEDTPDEERDRAIAEAMIQRKETVKKLQRQDTAPTDAERAAAEPAIDPEMLRTYIAYAQRAVPDPVFRDEAVRERMVEAFVTLRAANGYADDAAVPVSRRKLPDVHRIAEAAARAELSDTIEERHVEIAQKLVGESLRQFGQNEEGDLDADVVETGESKPQRERKKLIEEVLVEQGQEYEDGVPLDAFLDAAAEVGLDPTRAEADLQTLYENGLVVQPTADHYRWIGRA